MKPLPRNGQVPLSDVIAALASAPRAYHIEDRVVYRAVVFLDAEGQFRLFNARLEVGVRFAPSEPAVRKAGALRLLQVVSEIDEISSVETLTELLTCWRSLVGAAPTATTLQPSVWIRRDGSFGMRATAPSWSFEVPYSDRESALTGLPDGPFIEPTGEFCATDLGDAAAEWLRMPWLRQQSQPQKSVDVTLLDERASIGDIILENATLRIEIHRRTRQQLYCAIIARDYQGARHRLSLIVDSTQLSATIPVPARSLELYLVNAEGFCFDTYYEDEQRQPRKSAVLSSTAPESTEYVALREALNVGENEQIEFKKWLPLDREQPKSPELLKAVCAFANSLGGTMFIGVNDELEITGCAKGLHELARTLKLPINECRNAYIQLTRRVIAEGISPTVPVELSWLSHAGLDVFRINIRRTGTLHHVVESNDTYIRRGANSKKATPSDLTGMLRQIVPDKSTDGRYALWRM